MKKIIILLIFIINISGCCKYKELNNTYIIKTLMIDYVNNEYIIKANIIKDNKNNYENITIKSNDLNNIITKINQIYYKNVNLTHLDLLILTENSVTYKLKDIINYFVNNKYIRNNFNLAITNNKNIKLNDLYEKLNIIEKETGTIKNINFEHFIKDIYSNKKTYLPNIDNKGIQIIYNYELEKKLNTKETIIYNFITNNIDKCNLKNIKVYKNKTFIIINNKVNIYITSKISSKYNEYKNILINEIYKLNNKCDLFNKDLNIIIKGDIYEEH